MASLSASTGKDDGFVRLNISGNYRYPGVGPATPPARTTSNSATAGHWTWWRVTSPRSAGDHGSRSSCSTSADHGRPSQLDIDRFQRALLVLEPFYTRAASWSPDDSIIYTATTGFHLCNLAGSYPLTGICDTAAAFPATQATVNHRWINYTGCDSLYSTAAGPATAYFGGHERWSQNPNGCDFQGRGGISAPGMEGLSPTNGRLTFNPTRSRGLGADDMLLTSAGLWIASDNSTARTRAAVSPATPASASPVLILQNPKPLPARLAVAGSQARARQGKPNMSSTVRVTE